VQTALPEESSQVPCPLQVPALHAEQFALRQVQTTTPEVSSQLQFGRQADGEQACCRTQIPGIVPASATALGSDAPPSFVLPASAIPEPVLPASSVPPSGIVGTKKNPWAQPSQRAPVYPGSHVHDATLAVTEQVP
jgi:hypothetical protein